MANDAAKTFNIAGTLRHHLGSAKAALFGIPYWVWPLPVFLCAGIILIVQTPIGWLTEKPIQEIAAPVVIGLTAGLVVCVHRWMREFFTLLLACFVWALFLRELHFAGTSNGLYIALIVLAWLASSRRDEISDFLKWPSIRALLSCALWTYFITKLFDRHYVSFLPGYADWHNNVEESLETFAHVMVFALVVMTLRIGVMQGKSGAKGDRTSSNADAD